ncbi:MAG: hypothetical protein IJ679_07225 [Lachnospiraceae bacterium]|nr:hypothetical protein [Lachnospiraceae bacterium]
MYKWFHPEDSTSTKDDRPDVLSLSKDVFNAEELCVDIKVKVIFGEEMENAGDEGFVPPAGKDQDDILDQYIAYCKVFDAMMGKYGRTETAARKTIEACVKRGMMRR